MKIELDNKRDTRGGDRLLCDRHFSQHSVNLVRRAHISIKSGDGKLVPEGFTTRNQV
jgi:hypothetical protein